MAKVNREMLDNLEDTLENYKKGKAEKIDKRTAELISQGFDYDNGSGAKKFSLSVAAQTNITNTFIAKDLLTYPVRWNTIDDSEAIDIADATEMTAFYQTALANVKGRLDSGTALKDQVRGAADKSAVDSVIDNR